MFLQVVDGSVRKPKLPRYAARIRWKRDADPDWEIDTRHLGFESWRQAACFANGLSEDGASMLILDRGVLVVELVNGRDVIVESDDIVVWERMDRVDPVLPKDLTFVRASVRPRGLSGLGLDGPFRPVRFGVDDIEGSESLDVRVEADVRRQAVTVRLMASPRWARRDIRGELARLPQA